LNPGGVGFSLGDQLGAPYTESFNQYTKILETVAAGLRSGKIVVPK
jgi:hypothetical protein